MNTNIKGASSIVPDFKKFMGNRNKDHIQIVASISRWIDNLTILYPRYATREVIMLCKKTTTTAELLLKYVARNRNAG